MYTETGVDVKQRIAEALIDLGVTEVVHFDYDALFLSVTFVGERGRVKFRQTIQRDYSDLRWQDRKSPSFIVISDIYKLLSEFRKNCTSEAEYEKDDYVWRIQEALDSLLEQGVLDPNVYTKYPKVELYDGSWDGINVRYEKHGRFVHFCPMSDGYYFEWLKTHPSKVADTIVAVILNKYDENPPYLSRERLHNG